MIYHTAIAAIAGQKSTEQFVLDTRDCWKKIHNTDVAVYECFKKYWF